MHLNGLARKAKVCDESIEIAFMPYNTMKTQLVWQAVNDSLAMASWDDTRHTFVMLFGRAVEMHALVPEDELSLEAQGVLGWWVGCTGDYLANYELFISLVAMGLINELDDAVTSIDENLPEAPEILREGMPDEELDPNVERAGVKSGKKK